MSLTTTRVYRWDDPDAPALTGQAGSLITLLRACLVGTSGVAYGTGENEKQPAGWSEPFSASGNKAVFRNALAAGGTGMYFQVLDDGSGTGGGREAFGRSYSDMSDLDTGTHPAPSPSQLSTGNVLRKSATTDTTERGWVLVADERTFYLSIICNVEGNFDQTMIGAGDFNSEVPGDAFAYFCMGKTQQNSAFSSDNDWTTFRAFDYSTTTTIAGLYCGSGYSQTSDPVEMRLLSLGLISGYTGRGPFASPSIGSNKYYFIPANVAAEKIIRGQLRGLYVPMNDVSNIVNGTVHAYAAGLPIGSELTIISAGASYSNICRIAVETKLSWS